MTYKVKKLAEYWDCSYSTILNLIYTKKLHAFKIGTEWRIPEKEVIKYEEGESK